MTVISLTTSPPSRPSTGAGPHSIPRSPAASPLRSDLRLAADSSRAFVVPQGALVEGTAVHGLVRGARHIHRRGVAHAFGPDHVPRVTNEGPDPAVSLHVYAPRLEVQHDYMSDDGILRRVATRREGDDW